MANEITKETVEVEKPQSIVDWDNPKDVSFLKSMKAQGVAAPDAFSRLAKVKDQVKSPMAKHIEGLRELGKTEEEINKIISMGATVPDVKGTLQEGVEAVKRDVGAGAKAAIDPLIGAGKGALETVRTGLDIGEKFALGQAGIPQEARPEETAAKRLITDELTEADGGFQKAGKFVEQVGEFAAPLGASKKITAGASLFQRAATEGLISAGVASAKSGEVGKDAAISGALGFAFPFVGKGAGAIVKKLFGQKALAKAATGLTPTVTSNADDISQTVIKAGGKTAPAYESFDDFLVKEGFFKDGIKTDRVGMLKHARKLFELVTKEKSGLLGAIDDKIPVKKIPQLVPLIKRIIKANDDDFTRDTFTRMTNLLKGIEKGTIKKIGADVIDDVRFLADDILPTGAFKGAEPAKIKGLEKAIGVLRNFIRDVDTTGQIQHDNVVKRVLGTMLGFGKANNPMAIAADKSGAFKVFTDIGIGAAAGGGLVAAAVPGGQAVAAPLVLGGIAKAIADQPPVASALINQMSKIAGSEVATQIVKQLPLFLESALLAGGTEVVDAGKEVLKTEEEGL